MAGLLNIDPLRGILYQEPQGALSHHGLLGAATVNPLMARQVAAQRAANPRQDATDIFGYGPTWGTYLANMQRNIAAQTPQLGESGDVMVNKALGMLGNFGLLGMTKVMGRQAKAGGELGKNNEFYKGGQFLPSSEFTEKGKHVMPKSMRAGGKVEIEPGMYVVRPEDGLASMKSQIQDVMDWQHYRKTGEARMFNNPQYFDYMAKQTGKSAEQLQQEAAEAIEAWKSGARWVRQGELYDAAGNLLQ